ncbi:MAG TPA: hypothetical protein VFT99_25140, partial [Roseiflexaceae bacterium]|nr:hypothetical protein [Roseiflexaceae bacterium]
MPIGRFSYSRMLAGCIAVALAVLAARAEALDRVVFQRNDQQQRVEGRLLVTAEDGGLLMLSPDGALWTITPQELVEHTKDDAAFAPFSREELAKRLLEGLPAGFEVYETTHYLICYNTSRAYAQWCGGLFERLYMAFTNSWSRRGFDLHEPEFPLVALVFADQASYQQHARPELGDSVESIIG